MKRALPLLQCCAGLGAILIAVYSDLFVVGAGIAVSAMLIGNGITAVNSAGIWSGRVGDETGKAKRHAKQNEWECDAPRVGVRGACANAPGHIQRLRTTSQPDLANSVEIGSGSGSLLFGFKRQRIDHEIVDEPRFRYLGRRSSGA